MPDSAEPLDVASRLDRLEARMARLESCAEFDLPDDEPEQTIPHALEESIESQLAQTWFARVGVLALAAGGAYVLLQPHAGIPVALPSIVGWSLAGLLFVVARVGGAAFPLVARHVRAVAMALLYCATLRLCYFGAASAVSPTSALAHVLLPLAAVLNLLIAWYRRSGHLMALALLTAAATPLALTANGSVIAGVVLLSVVVAFVGSRPNWQALLGIGAAMIYTTYAVWATGNPLAGGSYGWMVQPAAAPLVLVACVLFLAAVPLWADVRCDSPTGAAAALANTLLGYGVVLIHSYAAHHRWFTALHVVTAVALLVLAAALRWKRQSEVTTFFYAMCAYAALMVAIVHVSEVPNVFAWLSVESVVVVATAIWFRSRFIVVTNFAIYVVVVLGYILVDRAESGVSIAFGLVALVSARILNWQRHRLALKTELMRNAYLVSAFVIFPYALLHLVGARYAALAWVGLAVIYYGLNLVIQNQKYRWMAHATLVLTTGYLLVPAHEGLTLPLRLASFVALGVAFLGVSVTSTLTRSR